MYSTYAIDGWVIYMYRVCIMQCSSWYVVLYLWLIHFHVYAWHQMQRHDKLKMRSYTSNLNSYFFAVTRAPLDRVCWQLWLRIVRRCHHLLRFQWAWSLPVFAVLLVIYCMFLQNAEIPETHRSCQKYMDIWQCCHYSKLFLWRCASFMPETLRNDIPLHCHGTRGLRNHAPPQISCALLP